MSSNDLKSIEENKVILLNPVRVGTLGKEEQDVGYVSTVFLNPNHAATRFFSSTCRQFYQRFLRAFLYECRFGSFFSSFMYVEKRRSYKKFVRITLMKLTPVIFGSHQHVVINTHIIKEFKDFFI